MVSDTLTNADRYRALSPAIARALDHVRQTPWAATGDGKHPIDGDRMFALVQRYQTKPLAQGRWEAHRRYVDLQVIVEGTERIGYTPIGRLEADPYDADKDLLWLRGRGDFLVLTAGDFALLWPEDAHMPGIAVDQPAAVVKVVVKIAVG